MTAQINDTFFYHGESHDIAGISEGELFDPAALGMDPAGLCSDCWRGWQAEYALAGRQLVIDVLNINLISREQHTDQGECPPGPPIRGVLPVGNGSAGSRRRRRASFSAGRFNNRYENLGYPLPYTGGLLLASGFIDDLYVHMGFHPAWKYEKVVELVFAGGVLQKECDRSAEMAELRKLVIARSQEPGAGDRGPGVSIREYIERAFDRRY